MYPRLDWMVSWRLSDYVDLHPDQEAARKARFADFMAWHRREELPRYSRDLRELADTVGGPVDEAVVAKWSARMRTHWMRSLDRLLPATCALARTLDDDQLRQIGKGLDESFEKFADKRVDRSPKDLRRDDEKRMIHELKQWIGSPNDAQLALIREWRDAHALDGAEQLAFRRRWRDAFLEILPRRGEGTFCEDFSAFFVDPGRLRNPAERAPFDENSRRSKALLVGIAAAMDDRQKAYLRKRLLDLASDLDDLAKEDAS